MSPKVKALTLAELKRIIKKYDDLMGIDPKGKKAPELRKEIEAVGYTIDDEKKMVIRKGKMKDKKKRPVKVDAGDPPPKKPPVDKSEALKKKKEMVIKLFLKHPEMHKEIMKDDRIKKQGGY